MLDIRETKNGVAFKVKVQPRASKNEITGLIDDALKLRLTSPPVDGAANEAVIKFFANLFKVPKNAVSIISGLASRNKTVEITGISINDANNILNH